MDVIGNEMQRKRTFFIKSECQEVALPVQRGDEAAGYWLLSIPPRVLQMVKTRSAMMKTYRKRNGTRGYALHTTTPGVLTTAPRCQMCGKAGACSHDRASRTPLPWKAFEVLPFCEYCGERLKERHCCGSCGATEYDVLAPPPTQERPQCVVKESRRHIGGTDYNYSYTLDSRLVEKRLTLVDPFAGKEETKRSKEAAGGAAVHDVTEYLRLDGEAGFEFKKKSLDVTKTIVLKALQKYPGKVCLPFCAVPKKTTKNRNSWRTKSWRYPERRRGL